MDRGSVVIWREIHSIILIVEMSTTLIRNRFDFSLYLNRNTRTVLIDYITVGFFGGGSAGATCGLLLYAHVL